MTTDSASTSIASQSVIIIGSGNFGAATALSLAQQGRVQVTLLDSTAAPNPRAASHDISKIVRDDYPDELYMRMLLKAMQKWRDHELYSPYYHEVGMLRADQSCFGDESIAAYRRLGVNAGSEFLPVNEVRRRWNGVFATSDFNGLERILYNPTAGFAEADRALQAVVKAAIDSGVKFIVGEMSHLVLGPQGQCTGVALKDGKVIQGGRILLAAGARTASLLVQSDPNNKRLHAGDRLRAAGAVSFYVKLHGEQREKFASTPVLKSCLPRFKGESMSMLKDGIMKFNIDMCFTNHIQHQETGETISMVPGGSLHSCWTGPRFLEFFERRALQTMQGLYGEEVENTKIQAYRMSWDALTPTHDFLITPHPHCRNLYLATGGSFHGWKFLPVIGDYIVAMMDGTLSKEYASRWSWAQAGVEGRCANPTYQIGGDLQEWIGVCSTNNNFG